MAVRLSVCSQAEYWLPCKDMKNELSALLERHVKGIQGESLAERATDRPAANGPRIGIQDHRQINTLATKVDVGDVGDPNLVQPLGFHAAYQIRLPGVAMLAVGGLDAHLPYCARVGRVSAELPSRRWAIHRV